MEQGFFPIIIFIILIIIFLSFYFSKKAVIKRKLKNAPFKNVSAFNNGELAKIVGRVEFVDSPLIAPLSQRECSYYHVIVEQKVSSGKSSRWKTIIEESETSKFVIKDGSRFAVLDDRNLKSYIVQDRKYSSGFLQDATNELDNYLNQHGYKSEGLLGFNKTIRYKEGILENGEEIAVLGKGIWKNASEIGLPAIYDKVLLIGPADNGHVYLSDDPDTTGKGVMKY